MGVNYGPYAGKLCVILDVVDNNRALVDGPLSITGVPRQQINFKRLVLTKFTIDINRAVREKGLKKAFTEANILEKWNQTGWAKKIARRNARENLNDFKSSWPAKRKLHLSESMSLHFPKLQKLKQ